MKIFTTFRKTNHKMKNNCIIVTLWCVVFGDTNEVKSVSVMEGDSVTLHINVTDIQQDEEVQWRFGLENRRLIAEIIKKKIKYEPLEGFIGRLDLNIQTGDLTIKNTRIKHAGVYKAVIVKSHGETTVNFSVTVNESSLDVSAGTDEETVLTTKGDSVTLDTGVQTQRGDMIVWRFGDEGVLIAKHDKEDNKSPIYYDGGSKDRLQVNNQTGSLTISDVRSSDSGLYKLKISSNSKQTFKTFIVSVSDGLSKGAKAGIAVSVLVVIAAAAAAAAFAGVIYHRHRISKLHSLTVEVFQGDYLTLPPDPKDIQTADEGEWIFGDKEIIARFNKKKNTFCTYDNVMDERFKDKLNLISQTGSLTIRTSKPDTLDCIN
ncbi:uncharacterized protein LOC130429562 [Triplophysa dalaica]|uniref:uncharacterized protein LOC130429562 n=1 Tax=Triplophysa dalaica TaxID=1582913 RepID=UPI0024E036C6|nr:uncharacterized protein LOC130429562 [Triplophysa dalaica]